jgi:catechol 2,3-dioxygenase-like lactoylglutathione lyase family enzyme
MTIHRITTMLPVRSMPASVAFYQKLGFRIEKQNSDWRWAMLSFGDCRLMVDESINVHPDAPRDAVLYLYADDVAAVHAEVRRNGLEVPDLDVTFYGMREFRIDDPDGNRLWIGQDPATGA